MSLFLCILESLDLCPIYDILKIEDLKCEYFLKQVNVTLEAKMYTLAMVALGLWIAWKRTRDTEEKILEESKRLSEEFSDFEKFISKEYINKMVVVLAWGINLFLIGSTIAISVILYDYHQAISVYPYGETIAYCGVAIALLIDVFRIGCELYFFYVKYPKLEAGGNVLLEYANTFTLGKYKNVHLVLDQVHTVIFTMLSVYAFLSLDI